MVKRANVLKRKHDGQGCRGDSSLCLTRSSVNVVFGILGFFILVVVMGDVVKTTLSTKGAGILTGWVAGRLWDASLWLHRRRPSHRLLSYVGMTILVFIISLWTFLMWLGWSLVFQLVPGAVVLAASGEPASFFETFYFTGYTLITLGNGEYRPEGSWWQFMTLLASTTGFFVVTLSITFLLSILPAVVVKRQTASYIASLGLTPEAIVSGQGGKGCDALVAHLPNLNSSIGSLAQLHLAFPVLHYFHATDRRTALPLRIAALDEALSYLQHGLPACEGAEALEPLRETITGLLESLEEMFYGANDEAPPTPSLEPLQEAGFNTALEPYRRAVTNDRERRRHLMGFVRRDGWEWEDIYRGASTNSATDWATGSTTNSITDSSAEK